MKVCAEPGCPELTPGTYCPEHEGERQRRADSRRPGSTARGYDAEHRRLRRQWKRAVDAGTVNCARCGGPILPGSRWDLGHDDHDRSKHTGPEHEHCNRSAGGRARGTTTSPEAVRPLGSGDRHVYGSGERRR